MQDHRCGTEADRPTPLLKPPADIDVVAGDPELLIEAPDSLQRLAPEGHVATGDVLCDVVREQDMRRAARCMGNRALDDAGLARREVGTADPGVIGGLEGVREEAEPVPVRPGVVVGESDDLARRRLDPGVPGG